MNRYKDVGLLLTAKKNNSSQFYSIGFAYMICVQNWHKKGVKCKIAISICKSCVWRQRKTFSEICAFENQRLLRMLTNALTNVSTKLKVYVPK